MTTIVFGTPKSSGKTTALILLACELSRHHRVTIIDADNKHRATRWAKGENGRRPAPPNINVIPVGEPTNIGEIIAEQPQDQYILVDLEGIMSQRNVVALSQADLVILTMNKKTMDIEAAIEIISEIYQLDEKHSSYTNLCVAFTRTSTISGRWSNHAAKQITSNPEIAVLPVEISERDAYEAMIAVGGSVRDLDSKSVAGWFNAVENAEGFTNAVLEHLKQKQDA